MYIMFETLSARYYQENKERLEKSLRKISKFFRRRKKKRQYVIVNVIKISQKMNKQKLVEFRKKYYRMRKNTFL